MKLSVIVIALVSSVMAQPTTTSVTSGPPKDLNIQAGDASVMVNGDSGSMSMNGISVNG